MAWTTRSERYFVLPARSSLCSKEATKRKIDGIDELILDLVQWLHDRPRPYVDVLDAWRTSCPRLPVWEEANERGLLRLTTEPGRGVMIGVTPAGVALLEARRPTALV